MDRLGASPLRRPGLFAWPVFLAAIGSPAAAPAADPGWERVDVPPVTTFLTDVWAYRGTDTIARAFAVGFDTAAQSGVIYHYNGLSWVTMPTSGLQSLYIEGVWGLSATDAFAVGNNVITRYNGQQWTQMAVYGNYNLEDVWASGPNDAFAVGANGLIMHYTGPKADPWTEWAPMNSGVSRRLYGVWGAGPNDVWAVGEEEVLIHYDGTQWSRYDELFFAGTARTLYGIHGTASNNVFAVGDGGVIRHFDGASWSTMNANTTLNFRGVYAFAGGAHAAGWSGKIFRYDGTSWADVGWTPATVHLEGISAAGDQDFFAVGAGGTFLHSAAPSTPWTAAWLSRSMASPDNYYGVWGSGPNDIFVVGDNGRIVRYNGTAWSVMNSGTDRLFSSVWGSSSSNVLAAVYQYTAAAGGGWNTFGEVDRYDGAAWAYMSGTMGVPCTRVWGSGPTDVFVVGEFGLIRHYNGSNWSMMDSGTDSHLQGVWGSGPSNVYAVGYDPDTSTGLVLRYNGSAWSQVQIGSPVHRLDAIWGSGPNDIFVVGSGGDIWHHNGLTWSTMSHPPPDPNPGWGGGTGALYNVWGTGPSDVFAVGPFGRIYHYNGTAWTRMYSGTLSDLNAVWGSGPSNVYAVGKDGLILHYPRTQSSGACCAAGFGNALPILSTVFLVRLLPQPWKTPRRRR
jgi:hypothetical protein